MKKYINKVIIMTIIAIITINMTMVIVQASNRYNQITVPPTKIRKNGINNFPDSYKVLLEKLVSKTGHTNWNFVALYTDIDWNELVLKEHEHLKNTIIKKESNTYPSSWYCPCNEEGDKNYYCASQEILEYYLDPRNFLTEVTIFEFLDLSNNSNITVSKIESLVSGTFLDGEENGIRYAKMIFDAAKESGESPYSLVIKIFQELGKLPKGTTPYVISGQDEKYPNVYNFYNYGAKDGDNNIELALKYAYDSGWNTKYKAIVEGAKLLSSSYLNQGQNTKYTYKFDIIGSLQNELYSHQYMTNIQDPTNQSAMLYDAYSQNGYLNNDLTFIIPVYKNMPTYKKLPNTQKGSNLYYVSSDYTSVYLRNGPGGIGSGYINLASLPKDTIVNVLQRGINGWSKVEYNDIVGYMSEAYLTPVNTKKDIYKVPSISTLPFVDVDADNWYYNSVKYVYENKMIYGITDTKFNPNGKLTRAMLITILWRMEGSIKVEGEVYPDVKADQYYYNAIKWAASKKIVNGYDDGKFRPNNYITREQLATILMNYASYKNKDVKTRADLTKYTDNKGISNYAKDSVSWAVAKKIISGKENGTKIDPRGTAIRAEAAAMITNYCNYVGR